MLHGRVSLIAYAIDGVISRPLAASPRSSRCSSFGRRGGGLEIAAEIAAAGISRAGGASEQYSGYDALGVPLRECGGPRQGRCQSRLLEPTPTRHATCPAGGNAVSYGMTWDQALRAVTLSRRRSSASRIATGSLEPAR